MVWVGEAQTPQLTVGFAFGIGVGVAQTSAKWGLASGMWREDLRLEARRDLDQQLELRASAKVPDLRDPPLVDEQRHLALHGVHHRGRAGERSR